MFSKFHDYFNVKVPEGIFFYPRCGGDILEPMELFGSLVDRMIFTDTKEITLPYANCGRIFSNNRLCSPLPVNGEEYFEQGMLQEVHALEEQYNTDIGPALMRDFYVNVGSVNLVSKVINVEYQLNNENKIKLSVFNNDGFLTLLSLSKIAVFFYRRDQVVERGGNQWWFSPQLFKTLISRLVDGAIILTDGRNFHPQHEKTSWSPLKNKENRSDFHYYGAHFEYLGELPYEKDSCCLYKITKSTQK